MLFLNLLFFSGIEWLNISNVNKFVIETATLTGKMFVWYKILEINLAFGKQEWSCCLDSRLRAVIQFRICYRPPYLKSHVGVMDRDVRGLKGVDAETASSCVCSVCVLSIGKD